MKKYILMVLFIVLLTGCGQVVKQTNDDNNSYNAICQNTTLEANNDVIVFLGDSIARNLADYSITNNCFDIPIINCGHGGDTIEQMVLGGNWQKAIDLKPKYIVINIGINDIICNHSFNEIKTEYDTMLKGIQSSNVKIFLITLPPILLII
jgi:hypothetical protein